jgi:hypothetical protein
MRGDAGKGQLGVNARAAELQFNITLGHVVQLEMSGCFNDRGNRRIDDVDRETDRERVNTRNATQVSAHFADDLRAGAGRRRYGRHGW